MEKQKTWTLELFSLLILVSAAVLIMSDFGSSYTIGPNYRNITVDTTVNITNSYPEVLFITIDPSPITLNAGTTRLVVVNVTVRDFEGFADIALVNATFFDGKVAVSTDPDDNNDHYTNTSCALVAGSGILANYTCHFNIWYYANNGTNWTANVTVQDQAGFNGTLTNQTTINSLLAINVTALIDFGNMAVGDTSATAEQANVTNFGNTLINISVYGFGNETGDGLAMVCDQRNISIAYERFHNDSSEPYATMTPLASGAQNFPGIQLVQRVNDTPGGEVVNGTYWRIQIPVATNPAGRCNGSVVFQAESP